MPFLPWSLIKLISATYYFPRSNDQYSLWIFKLVRLSSTIDLYPMDLMAVTDIRWTSSVRVNNPISSFLSPPHCYVLWMNGIKSNPFNTTYHYLLAWKPLPLLQNHLSSCANAYASKLAIIVDLMNIHFSFFVTSSIDLWDLMAIVYSRLFVPLDLISSAIWWIMCFNMGLCHT